MSISSREAVLEAIKVKIQGMVFYAPINGSVSFNTVSRRLRLWGDVPGETQPAAFLVEHEEQDEWRGLGLDRRRLACRVWCYARTDDPETIGGSYLNIMLDAFDDTFGMSAQDNFATGQLTLGGLVYWCRMGGKIFKDPGDIDNQALMIVNIEVEMP